MARIVFLGSPDFAVPSLRALLEDGHEVVAVVTQPDREAGRRRVLHPPAVKVAAEELGLRVLQPPTLRSAHAVEELAALRPELMVVAAFGQILRPNVLEIPAHGAINVHASLLPRWRGASPVAAAILAGDAVTGVSVMLMEAGLDTGPVLAVRETPIADADTAGSLTERLAELGATLLWETVPRWLAGALTPVPQENERATYAPRLDKEAGRIDWREPATTVWRKVRAYAPWPSAFTSLGETQIRILAAWPLAKGATGQPGEVVALPPEAAALVPAELPRPAFAVITGEGLLVPLKLQKAGKLPLFAEEFARGERHLLGGRLGDVVR